jgi:hypothetical protein
MVTAIYSLMEKGHLVSLENMTRLRKRESVIDHLMDSW